MRSELSASHQLPVVCRFLRLVIVKVMLGLDNLDQFVEVCQPTLSDGVQFFRNDLVGIFLKLARLRPLPANHRGVHSIAFLHRQPSDVLLIQLKATKPLHLGLSFRLNQLHSTGVKELFLLSLAGVRVLRKHRVDLSGLQVKLLLLDLG